MPRAPLIGFEALPRGPRRCELLTTFEPRTAIVPSVIVSNGHPADGPSVAASQKINRRIQGWLRAGDRETCYLRRAGKKRGNAPRNCGASVEPPLGGCPRHRRLIAQAKSRGRPSACSILAAVLRFSPDYLTAKSPKRQTIASGWCFLPVDQYLPSPRPSGGSLVIIGPGTGCQGQWLFWEADGAAGWTSSRMAICSHRRRGGPTVLHHPRCGKVDLMAESACRWRSLRDGSRRLREPTRPGRNSKNTGAPLRLQNQIKLKASLSFADGPVRWHRAASARSKLRGARGRALSAWAGVGGCSLSPDFVWSSASRAHQGLVRHPRPVGRAGTEARSLSNLTSPEKRAAANAAVARKARTPPAAKPPNQANHISQPELADSCSSVHTSSKGGRRDEGRDQASGQISTPSSGNHSAHPRS